MVRHRQMPSVPDLVLQDEVRWREIDRTVAHDHELGGLEIAIAVAEDHRLTLGMIPYQVVSGRERIGLDGVVEATRR